MGFRIDQQDHGGRHPLDVGRQLEQKLINEYNAANLGVYGGSKSSDEAKAKIASYKDFLAARAALKAQIDADCAELNIE